MAQYKCKSCGCSFEGPSADFKPIVVEGSEAFRKLMSKMVLRTDICHPCWSKTSYPIDPKAREEEKQNRDKDFTDTRGDIEKL